MTQNCQNSPTVRRLAAIMFADVAGFSRLMERNEALTFSRLRRLREEVNFVKVEEHGGRVIRATGDGFLAEFGSAIAAVQCGLDIQRTVMELEQGQAASDRIRFRIGINVGDIIVDGDDIAGDGVNIAARLEALAPVDGICVSSMVREQIRDDLGFTDMGEQKLKNIARPIRTYGHGARMPRASASPPLDKPLAKPVRLSIVVLPFTNVSGDPAQEYFSDGITDEVTAQLSRIKGSYVIGRDTAIRYKGKEVDIRALGVELGVRYVLRGSVERFDQGIDTTAQLWDALSGTVLWADTMEVDKAAVRNIRREVVNRLAIALNLQLIEAEARHSENSESPDATDLVMQARAAYYRANTLEALQQVRAMFEKALSINANDQAGAGGPRRHHGRTGVRLAERRQCAAHRRSRPADGEGDAAGPPQRLRPLRDVAAAPDAMPHRGGVGRKPDRAGARSQPGRGHRLERTSAVRQRPPGTGNRTAAAGAGAIAEGPHAMGVVPDARSQLLADGTVSRRHSLAGAIDRDQSAGTGRTWRLLPWLTTTSATTPMPSVRRAQFEDVYRGEVIEPRFYSQTPAYLELLDARVMPAWRKLGLPEPDSPTSHRRLR